MNLTESELRDLVKEKLDPEELIELLGITTYDLAEQFSHRLLSRTDEIQDYLYPEDFTDE